jgi:trimethylamine corrinoid protein
MPNEQLIYDQLKAAIIDADTENLLKTIDDALRRDMRPVDLVENGLTPGMREIGEMFRRYEVYLPEMMMSAETWEQAMQVLEPKIAASADKRQATGRVVIGTVKDDIHSLGKNIVTTMLNAAGFEVFDLGIDVPASAFAIKAEEIGADVIAVSALMTTTMPQQRNVIEHLEARGVRDKYYVIVGGGVTTQEWANEIGADGYGETAGDAVALALEAVAEKAKGNDK